MKNGKVEELVEVRQMLTHFLVKKLQLDIFFCVLNKNNCLAYGKTRFNLLHENKEIVVT